MARLIWASVISIIGFTASNYFFQAQMDIPDYDIAWERSFFQWVAVFGLNINLVLLSLLDDH